MNLPPELVDELEGALETRVEGAATVAGGCIHHSARVDTAGGPVFCKWNRGDAGAAFGAEARGLEALGRASAGGGLRIPRVLGFLDAGDGEVGWLALEFLPPSEPAPDHDETLGRGLAHLHRATPERWGWAEDNRIGSLHQANPSRDSWGAFWRDARLGPQIRLAADGGRLGGTDRDLMERAAAAAPALLAAVEDDGPSLIHGDLWAGNVHPGPDGRPVLVDPAIYRGHREVDLAMADLFGGVPPRARRAYEEAAPLRPGHEARRPLYQLYYLLVHLNLFGAGYLAGCRDAARRVAGAA